MTALAPSVQGYPATAGEKGLLMSTHKTVPSGTICECFALISVQVVARECRQMNKSSARVLFDAHDRWRTSLGEYRCAVRRTKAVIPKACAEVTRFFDLWDSLKQLAGGTDSLYTVCGGRPEVLDIADKEGDLSEEFLDIMKELRPPDLLEEETVNIQAALMTDTVPRMVAEYCSLYDSARAQVLAIEAAFLADLPILQEINKAATAQVELIPPII